MPRERIIAVGLLTDSEIARLGGVLARLWPVEEIPCFGELLRTIDEAEAGTMQGSGVDMDAVRLKAEADRCRMLASTLANQSTVDMLNRMADEFDQAAAEQEAQMFFSEKQINRDG